MATERNGIAALQARLDMMIAEFRAARQRRLLKQGIALWERTEMAQRELDLVDDTELPPTKIN
jgi:hypothetical protein